MNNYRYNELIIELLGDFNANYSYKGESHSNYYVWLVKHEIFWFEEQVGQVVNPFRIALTKVEELESYSEHDSVGFSKMLSTINSY